VRPTFADFLKSHIAAADITCDARNSIPVDFALCAGEPAMMAVPKIPGYELLSCLGGGMMTSVYSARALDGDSPCAVKLLRPDWQDQPVAIKLLQREARACLSISQGGGRHKHLVQIQTAHVTCPPYFLVMEMLAGESLRRRIRRDYRLDVPTALWIVRQVAEALAVMHRKGFIHGDVKPDNIRVVADGQAILLDLGFAHRPGENASLLEAGYVLGTVNYLAPELCGSEPQDDFRCDIFSLGVTLFELLTGQLPYAAGTTSEILQRHQSEQPRDIRSLNAAIPARLADVVGRMLMHDYRQRPRAVALVGELINLEIATLGQRRSA
jgi:serine/threonine protein kinase